MNSSDFHSDSDIDLLVDFEQQVPEEYADNFFDLCDDLELLLKRKVDITTTKSLHNPIFRKEVENSKQLIFSV